MTKTTDKRQMGLIARGILLKHGIDNLQVEIDITSAFHRYFFERKGVDLAELRESILRDMQAAGEKLNEKIEMEKRVRDSMGISVDGRSRYDDMISFLLKMDKEGQTVEQYATWIEGNPFTAPKFFKIAERPDTLIETWSMAFDKKQTNETPGKYDPSERAAGNLGL